MDSTRRPHLLAIALTAAVAFGILLGNSTIAAIDPAHFRSAAPPPREFAAAAVIGQPETPYYGRPAAYGDPAAMRAALCPECDRPLVVAGTYSASVPYFGSREERAAIETAERRAIDASYAAREHLGESRRSRTGMGGPRIDYAVELELEREARRAGREAEVSERPIPIRPM